MKCYQIEIDRLYFFCFYFHIKIRCQRQQLKIEQYGNDFFYRWRKEEKSLLDNYSSSFEASCSTCIFVQSKAIILSIWLLTCFEQGRLGLVKVILFHQIILKFSSLKINHFNVKHLLSRFYCLLASKIFNIGWMDGGRIKN